MPKKDISLMVCLFTVQLKATNKPKIIFASAKNTRTKVVLARILEKKRTEFHPCITAADQFTP